MPRRKIAEVSLRNGQARPPIARHTASDPVPILARGHARQNRLPVSPVRQGRRSVGRGRQRLFLSGEVLVLSQTVFAWHGRELAPRRGAKPRLASKSVTAAPSVGRPQRSCAEALRDTPSAQGRCPCTPNSNGEGRVRPGGILTRSENGSVPCPAGRYVVERPWVGSSRYRRVVADRSPTGRRVLETSSTHPRYQPNSPSPPGFRRERAG